jgi:predicted CopG family antitoxin
MPVIKLNDDNFNELHNRKHNNTDSMNDVVSRLLNGSKEFIIDGQIIEVIPNARATTFTVKPRRGPIPEKTISD